ncbi:MAG: hypothetical protein HRT89_03515, partial [Lentisphaeria bacterium]|nr:hypothetical protein [Lentisphaeria bacterium]
KDDNIEEITENIINFDKAFRDCLLHEQILGENRQLSGADLRYVTSWMIISQPHPDRHDKVDELTDVSKRGWHRDLRPKWGVFPHDEDSELINTVYNNSMVLLTVIGDGDGGTLLLDGSYKMEGVSAELSLNCPVSQVKAPAGSVVYFSETLVHSAAPILTEKERVVLFIAYAPPWFKEWFGAKVPQRVLDDIDNEELRNILEGWDKRGYKGQNPVE